MASSSSVSPVGPATPPTTSPQGATTSRCGGPLTRVGALRVRGRGKCLIQLDPPRLARAPEPPCRNLAAGAESRPDATMSARRFKSPSNCRSCQFTTAGGALGGAGGDAWHSPLVRSEARIEIHRSALLRRPIPPITSRETPPPLCFLPPVCERLVSRDTGPGTRPPQNLLV